MRPYHWAVTIHIEGHWDFELVSIKKDMGEEAFLLESGEGDA